MGLLSGRTALITGATRGIGVSIAERFAAEGANVAFTGRSVAQHGAAIEERLSVFGTQVKGYSSDASNFEDTRRVVEQVKEDFGRIDILVNNAGITHDGLMLRMTESQWDEVIGVNLKSAFNFVNAVSPIMLSQRAGCIISVSSVVGIHGNAGQANYAASKAGLIALTKSVAAEFGARGIRANCIAPGFVETDMTSKLPAEMRVEWCKKIPLRRWGAPEDIANVALFLASDLAAYVTGQVIVVDGGMCM